MKRYLVVALIVGLVATSLAVGVNAQDDNVIKIGAAVSLTGRVAPSGKKVRNGYKVWADYVNSHGGIQVGDKSYKVKMVYYDDKSKPQTGAKLTQKLITQDNVDFLFGPFSSGITFATSAIGEKYGVITIAPEANATKVYNRGFNYIFSILPPAPALCKPIFDLAATFDPVPKRVAILSSNDLFPLSTAKGARNKVKKMDEFKLVMFKKYPADTNDITTLLSQAKAKNPDILLDAGYTKDAQMVVRQSKEIGLNVDVLATSVGAMLPEFLEGVGENGNYVLEGEWWLPYASYKGPVFGTTDKFVKLYKKRFGKLPDYHASSGAAAGVVLQLAIKKAGSIKTAAVKKALNELSVDEAAVWPRIEFNEKGQNIKAAHPVMQIQNEKYETVWPPKAVTADPLYPIPKWSER